MAKDNTTDSYTMDDELSPNFYSVDFYQKRKKGKFRLCLAPKCCFPVADTHCHVEMFERPWWVFIRAAVHNVGFIACVVDSTDDGIEGIKKVDLAYKKASQMLPDIIDQINNSKDNYDDQITIQLGDSPALCLDKDSICKNPKMPCVRYIVGTHPHYAKNFDEAQEQNLRKMLKNPKVACVGEIGLDFHYDLSPRDLQVEVFKKQLKIADELGFPVSLHLREAHDVALKVFKEIGFSKHGVLLHCFNLGPKELKPWVDAGCYIALGGPLTFKKSFETREAVKMIHQDKLLTETDAPFMTPEPVRGDTCFSDHVIFTADKLCEVLDKYSCKQSFYAQMMDNAQSLLNRAPVNWQK